MHKTGCVVIGCADRLGSSRRVWQARCAPPFVDVRCGCRSHIVRVSHGRRSGFHETDRNFSPCAWRFSLFYSWHTVLERYPAVARAQANVGSNTCAKIRWAVEVEPGCRSVARSGKLSRRRLSRCPSCRGRGGVLRKAQRLVLRALSHRRGLCRPIYLGKCSRKTGMVARPLVPEKWFRV